MFLNKIIFSLLVVVALFSQACKHTNEVLSEEATTQPLLEAPPTPPAEVKKIKTRFGEAQLVKEGEMYNLKLDDKIIFQDDSYFPESHSLITHGELKGEDYLLLSCYAGDGCPELDLLVIFNYEKKHFFRLGNCNTPNIVVTPGKLTISYRGEKVPLRKPESWVYSGGKLSKVK